MRCSYCGKEGLVFTTRGLHCGKCGMYQEEPPKKATPKTPKKAKEPKK